MTMVNAWAASEAGGALSEFQYELGPIGPQDVDIDVEHCGICHSDVSMINNEWEMSAYPLVPGHEVIGVVSAIGAGVTHLGVGDRVGLGWHAGYCMTCPQCMTGHHNTCASASSTIIGRHGGFADKVRAQAAAVVPLPEGLDAAAAGPLLCGGVTVFSPLVRFGISPTDRVAVIGIGGLGHMALQFLRAWGCAVTAFTSTESKTQEALELGAHDTINSRDPADLEAAAGCFDLIISTVNVGLDWNGYVQALRPRGRLHILGAVLEPIELGLFGMLLSERSVSASPVGPPATMAKMLEFAARHGVTPVVERFPMGSVNEAIAHLEAGSARYRVVLDRG